MRNIVLLFLSLSPLVLGLNSCYQEKSLDKVNSEYDIHKELIHSWGRDTAGMYELTDYYLVEKEILFSKEKIRDYLNSPRTRMHYDPSNGFVDFDKQKIVVNVSTLSGTMKSCVINAMTEWNSIDGCNIHFYRNDVPGAPSGAPTVSFKEVSVTEYGSLEATFSERPFNGSPGAKIQINTKSGFWKLQPSADKIRYAFMHALGHIVGFEDMVAGSSSSFPAYQRKIAGTTERDYNSIMRGDTFTRNGFTNADLVAFKTVYPEITLSLTGPTIGANNKLTFNLENTTGISSVSWSCYYGNTLIPPTSYSSTNTSLVITPTRNGLLRVVATASYSSPFYSNFNVTAEKSYTVQGIPLAPPVVDVDETVYVNPGERVILQISNYDDAPYDLYEWEYITHPWGTTKTSSWPLKKRLEYGLMIIDEGEQQVRVRGISDTQTSEWVYVSFNSVFNFKTLTFEVYDFYLRYDKNMKDEYAPLWGVSKIYPFYFNLDNTVNPAFFICSDDSNPDIEYYYVMADLGGIMLNFVRSAMSDKWPGLITQFPLSGTPKETITFDLD